MEGRARAFGKGSLLAALVALAAAPCLGQAAVAASGPPAASRGDLVLSPRAEPLAGAARFRFAPDGAWARCDRDLVLSAARGEERLYRIELEASDGTRRSLEYLIDKRPPSPPSAAPAGGLFEGPVTPELRAEAGAAISWAMIGPGGGAPSFAALSAGQGPRIERPAAATETYTLLAYAEDAAGNRSLPARFVYRVAPKGLPAEAPAAPRAEAALVIDRGLPPPRVERKPGGAELRFEVPAGSSLLAGVGLASSPARPSELERIEASEGVALLTLACPYAWSGKIPVHYGIEGRDGSRIAPDPIMVELAFPVAETAPPPAPDAPSLVADASGRGSFVLFPTYEGKLFVSVDDGALAACDGPIYVAPGPESIRLAWYGEDGTGLRSAAKSLRLSLPPPVPEARVTGVEDGALLGSAARLLPSSAALIRYELRSGPSASERELPAEPGASSPLLGEGLNLDCPQGEERWFALRYRAFATASVDSPAGESSLLRFSIDRKPPAPPRLLSAPPAYVDRAVDLAFDAGEPGSALLAAVSIDGAPADFQAAGPLLRLPGADAGPVSYSLRAYRVDAAGNRSAEMPAVALVVDRSSVYAASDAPEAGDGSPARPFRGLDAAVAAALAQGKRSVNLRGSFTLTRPVDSSAPLALVGGFAPGWARDRSARVRIEVAIPAGVPAFRFRGSALSLKGLDLSLPALGAGAAIEVSGGDFAVSDCSLTARGAGDILVAGLERCGALVERTTLALEKGMACAAFRTEDADLALRDTIITARAGVRAFTAIDAQGGSLAVSGSLLESSADLALSLLSLRRTRLLVDRSLLRADTGSGYLRMGAFEGVEGELRNSRVLVSWAGPGILFETSGASPAFRHLTVSAETSRGRLDCFSALGSTPEIWNSILSFPAGGGVFLRSDRIPGPGRLVADCIWGFERLVDGAATIGALRDLDALNAGAAAYASRPHVSEPPSRTFSAPIKTLSPLSRDSACVDAAYPLDGPAYALDFKGAPRPAGWGKALPDIGADEAGE